ncbi:MAG: TetR/AcrR family transcriptional regulator [Mycobacterium sp.]
MSSAPAATGPGSPVLGARELQRLQTRARLFDAAVAEIARCGIAGADVAAIAAAVGVARGTFYFHFPTKEHVLVELERAEEVDIAARLEAGDADSDDLMSLLKQLVCYVLEAEQRLGPMVFRDMLGLHFSATQPVSDELVEHPLAQFVIAAIAKAQMLNRVSTEADARELGLIFMTGLFALLAIGASGSGAGSDLLDRYVTTLVRGMEAQ